MNMRSVGRYLRNLFSQPSTYRGLFLLAGALGAKLSPDLQSAVEIFTTGAILAGGVGAVVPDKRESTKQKEKQEIVDKVVEQVTDQQKYQ